MALTVTALMSTIDLAESATPWSSATLDAALFKQGSNSAAIYMAKNIRGSETVTPAASVSWSTYTYPHLYFWMNSSVAALMENKSTGTTTASGVTVRVTLSSGAYREWHVCGADTWAGDWTKCFVIDMSHSGTQLYASSGTWTNASNIASVTWYFDLSNSGNIRNVPANCWLDAIRVGEGLQVHNTSATDASFDFAAIAAVDENVSNQYGVLRTLEDGAEGQFGAAGKIIIGDDSGSNHCDFDSQDETLVFMERDGSGYGLINASLYELNFVGNATGTDQDVSMGVKVGTGASMSGRNGTQVRAGGTTVSYTVDMSDADLHSVGFYGSTFQGADRGIGATGIPTTTFEIGGCTYDGCDQIDTRDAVVRNSNFLNTVAVATSGALLWDENETDAEYCLFVNNAVAVEIPDLTDDVTFTGHSFQGNTYDVRYEGTEVVAGDKDFDLYTPVTVTIQNSSTGTLTAIVAPVTLTIHVVDQATGLDLSGATVFVWCDTGGSYPSGASVTITRSVSTASVAHTAHGLANGDKVWIQKATQPEYNGVHTISNVTTNAYDYTVSGTPTTPATGTITATLVLIDAQTDANGEAAATRTYDTDQPVLGRVRKATL